VQKQILGDLFYLVLQFICKCSKKAIKLVHIYQRCHKIKSGLFFETQCTFIFMLRFNNSVMCTYKLL